MPLDRALREFTAVGQALLSRLLGRLGLYVGEDGSSVWLLERTPEGGTA